MANLAWLFSRFSNLPRFQLLDIDQARNLMLSVYPYVPDSTQYYLGRYFSRSHKFDNNFGTITFELILLHAMSAVLFACGFLPETKFGIVLPDKNDSHPYGIICYESQVHLFMLEDGLGTFIDKNGKLFSLAMYEIMKGGTRIIPNLPEISVIPHVFSLRKPSGNWENITAYTSGLPDRWKCIVYQWDNSGNIWFSLGGTSLSLYGPKRIRISIDMDIYGPLINLNVMRNLFNQNFANYWYESYNIYFLKNSRFELIDEKFPIMGGSRGDILRAAQEEHRTLRAMRFGPLSHGPVWEREETPIPKGEESQSPPEPRTPGNEAEPSLLVKSLLAPIRQWKAPNTSEK